MTVRILSWSFAAFAATVACGTLLIKMPQSQPESVPDDVVAGGMAMQRIDVRTVRDFLPKGAKIIFDKPNARGWKQMGRMPLDMECTMSEIEGFLKDCGYSRQRDVGGVDAGHVLTEWKSRSGHRVMWAVWPEGRNCTGFSWGEVQ